MDTMLLIQLALVLVGAKLAGEFCERVLKQPAVLGELVLGVLLGGSVLHFVSGSNQVLVAMGAIGAVLLLFEVGLESDISDLAKVGGQAAFVAVVGVVAPMVLGYFGATWLGHSSMESLFVGCALTATSVGITARVFGDLNFLKRKEAHVVLGAAVIDDVIGLVILAVVGGLATSKVLNLGAVAVQALVAVLFLVGSLVIGFKAFPWFISMADRMKTRAAISSAALVLCFALSAAAEMAHLAPIVGAFAAGLVLNRAEQKVHFEKKIKSIADLFIPVFFVMMGAQVDLKTLDPSTAAGRSSLVIGGVLLLIAVVTKVVAGLMVPGRGLAKWVVGIGMVPRGEVGLIFASIGLQTKVISPSLYSALLFVIMMTTFVTPPLLRLFIRDSSAPAEEAVVEAKQPEPAVA